MRRLLAASALLLALGATPAMARDYPWCARMRVNDGNPDCRYTYLWQCQATISGIGGDCILNPGLAFDRSGVRRNHRSHEATRQNDGWNADGWGNRRW